jgi:uroporphyrin-III C-methyltransferase/precorrin-2 dehydrogenase/sirohydrochlorin ferrochelatase
VVPASAAPSEKNDPAAPRPFPAFLHLRGRSVLLVGGGPVAVSKLGALLDAGARVTVVAPALRPELERPGVELLQRPFAPPDLERRWLVVSAAPAAVNRAVAEAAAERCLFVNAVDDPETGSVWLGGVVRRGDVTVAISTSGRAPALAGLLREALDALLPAELQRWVERAESLRAQWRHDQVALPDRRPLLLRALVDLYARRGEW